MWPRIAVVVVAAAVWFGLAHVSLRLPAFEVLGLLAWAVLASVAAVVFWRRSREYARAPQDTRARTRACGPHEQERGSATPPPPTRRDITTSPRRTEDTTR